MAKVSLNDLANGKSTIGHVLSTSTIQISQLLPRSVMIKVIYLQCFNASLLTKQLIGYWWDVKTVYIVSLQFCAFPMC